MKKLHFYLIPVVALLIFASCEDPDSSPRSLLNVILKDSPAQWDSVFVEIEGVDIEVLVEGRDTQTLVYFLEYKSGDKKIKVSDLVAGNELLLGRSELPIGQIIGATILLGDDHYMYLDEKKYTLNLADGSNNEISLTTSIDIEQGYSYDILLDINLEKSIIQVAESPLTYNLDPYFTLENGAGTVEIDGNLTPLALYSAIYLSDGTDSISTHTDEDGEYFFRVQPGSYTFYFDPKDELYQDTTFSFEVLVDTDSTLDDIIFKLKP